MTSVLRMIAKLFTDIFNNLDRFYLVGQFSIVDFAVVCLAIDIVIGALFVTFNSSVGGDYDFRSEDARRWDRAKSAEDMRSRRMTIRRNKNK